MKTPELYVTGLISEDGGVLIGDHIKLLASSQVSPEAAEQGALQPLLYLASDHQYFQFTYYYGNGDFYRGYGYAVQDAYAYGEVLGPYANDGRDDGYYVIDYVANESGPGVQGYITINTYYDATIDSDSLGVGGYGFADLVWGEGFFGLGSEIGEAYNIYGEGTGDNTFNFSASADLIANDQEYGFTFYYANGDYYRGYGYASAGLYTVGQVIPISGPDQLDGGHYEINFVSDLGIESFNDTYVSVISYFDAATDSDGVGLGGAGSASYVWGESHAGLGSEWGYAYNGNFDLTGDNYFTNTNSADMSLDFYEGEEKYEFTYHYGDGDYYVGHGIASPGTYFVGQVISGIPNETNHLGYYSIDRVYSLGYESNAQGSVSVHTYFDGATDGDGLGSGGYGYANSVYGEGFNGLGSEVGYAYNIDAQWTGDNYFTNASSADIYSTSGDQEFGFTYYFGDGDFYSGYGYTGSGTYQPGQVIGQFWNDTNNWGYYVIDYAYDLGYESIVDGSVYIHTYYDGATDADGMGGGGYGTAFSAFGGGNAGLGSEIGEAYNYLYDKSGDNAFSNTNSADLILGDQQYNYTYYYGNGDYYRGFGYAISGTYAKGQWLPGVSNDTNNPGYYLIDDVQELGYNTFENFVWITDYFDAAIDLDGIGIAGNGYASHVTGEGDDGLGSESGEAFNSDYLSTGDNLISNSSSADIDLERDQVFVFTYYYGDGDFYGGYGYSNVHTYSAGDVIGPFYNETGNPGYYVIDYTYTPGVHSFNDGDIIVDSYYDAVTDLDGVGVGGNGYASYVYGHGYGGLWSEWGEAYDVNHYGTGDNYFSNASSADILFPGNQEFGFTYHYGDGDYYQGIGYAALGTYSVGQTIGSYPNDTGNNGYYVIDYILEPRFNPHEIGMIYLGTYYDAATDTDGTGSSQHGSAYLAGGGGSSGLGSESGEAYNYDFHGSGDNYFSNSSSADIALGVDQVFTFTYYYGDGDTYNGYGFANAGTYFAGQRLEFYSNDTSHLGYYIIDAVADLGYETDDEIGSVYVHRYYDANTDLDGLGLGAQGAAANVWGVGYDGLGSEIGEAYNSFFENSDDNVFTNSNSADLAVSGYQEFGFTYYYGDGDYYMGYGHAAGNLYHEGQVVSGVYNDTGNIGYYTINYVASLSSASYEGDYIVLQSYYDSATDLDGIAVGSYGTAYSCWGEDAVALGAESGEAYSEAFAATGDNAFSAASSADLLLPTTFSLISSSADKKEGDGSSKKFTFSLTRSGDLSQSCSVDWSVTASGAHPAGKDDFFTGGFRSGSIRFAQGEATRNISLRISGDTLYEPDEQFTVFLSNPVGGSIDPNFAEATGIIRNDDPIPLPVLSIAATAADKLEGSGSKRFTFTVNRSGDLSQASSAEWFLVGSGPNPAGPDDFLTDSFKSGILRFKADESSRELSIRIRGDLTPEPDEQFSVVLFNAIGAFIEPSSAEAIGIIRNDDLISPAALSPRLSNPQSFAGGGSYWGDTVLPGSVPSLSPLTSEGVAAFTNSADLPFTHLLSNTSFH